MRNTLSTLVFFVAMATLHPVGAANQGNGRARVLREGVQLAPAGLHAALAERNSQFLRAAWPEDVNAMRVDASLVPDDVVEEVARWLRTMISSEYLPNDPKRWLIPIRKPKPGFYRVIEMGPDGPVRKEHVPEEGFDDYFVMKYGVGGYRFQIQDNASAVLLLVDVNDSNLHSSNARQFITNVLYEVLKYPVQYKDALVFNLRNFEYGDATVWFGVVDCNFDLRDAEARARRAWWNHTYVWTDGRRAYFSLVKRSGEPPTTGARNPRPGLPRRFR